MRVRYKPWVLRLQSEIKALQEVLGKMIHESYRTLISDFPAPRKAHPFVSQNMFYPLYRCIRSQLGADNRS